VTDEARLEQTDTGLVPHGEGWFIVNLGEVSWWRSETRGTWSGLGPEGERWQIGIGVHILEPGQAPGFYHREDDQEGFLVLTGECIVVVEGEEREMRQWDYFHCPPGTHHITVGAGDGPCAILMVGARTPGKAIHYPVDETAARHGQSVAEPADSAAEAYAGESRRFWRVPAPWPPA
jgi:uncharacterized cupin superfamily protein